LQEVAAFARLPKGYVRYARQSWLLIQNEISPILSQFYDFMEDSGFTVLIERPNRDRLITAQAQHWQKLFTASFSEDYLASAKAIGLRHRLIDLSPSAYISGYGFLSNRISSQTVKALPHDPALASQLLLTTQSLIFIDMSLALSVYNDDVELL